MRFAASAASNRLCPLSSCHWGRSDSLRLWLCCFSSFQSSQSCWIDPRGFYRMEGMRGSCCGFRGCESGSLMDWSGATRLRLLPFSPCQYACRLMMRIAFHFSSGALAKGKIRVGPFHGGSIFWPCTLSRSCDLTNLLLSVSAFAFSYASRRKVSYSWNLYFINEVFQRPSKVWGSFPSRNRYLPLTEPAGARSCSPLTRETPQNLETLPKPYHLWIWLDYHLNSLQFLHFVHFPDFKWLNYYKFNHHNRLRNFRSK